MQALNGMNGSVVGASATYTSAQEERLDRLEEQVQRILRSMEAGGGQSAPVAPRFSGATPTSSAPLSFDKGRAKLAREKIRERRWREQFLAADLFADPAWDMLLDLYAACYERRQVSVSSLCIAAAVPATTALRWIKNMTDAGLLERSCDPNDARRIFLGISEKARLAMDRYFDKLVEGDARFSC